MGNTPNVRFKGFTENWEQRKLGDFGKATGGTSIESEFSEDGIYKVISIGSYSENSVYNDQGIRAIKSDKTSNRVLNRNDLTMILNDKTTSGNIIGRVLLIEESGIYVYNQRTERIEINLDEYDPVFLYEMLNAPNIREKIIKQAQGNTQIYVNWTAISLLEYMIPSKEEQVKIGEYLHSISNLITLHQQKCDETKELKKYMLQNMFPQKDEKVPKIRFAGFTGDWEQRKLGELGTVQTCKRIFKEQTSEQGDIPFFKNGTIGLEPDSYISREVYEEFRRLYPYPEVGDTLISVVGSIGRTAEYTGKDEYFQDSNVVWLKTDGSINKKFLKISYQVIKWLIEGSTVKHLYNDNILRSEIVMPVSQIEQAKIAEFFEELDQFITLHQQKCAALKEFKKYMLQNMFPQKGENKCQN